MSATNSTDPEMIAFALNQLENLPANTFVIGYGPDGKKFIGTPNEYAASYLPAKVFTDITSGHIRRIIWASFGSNPDSWSFAYEMKDDTLTFRLGPVKPPALQEYLEQLNASNHDSTSLRIQFGDKDTFVVCTPTEWACSNVPQPLMQKLCELSSTFKCFNGVTIGFLRTGTLENVQWHQDGSYYIKSGNLHAWDYQTRIAQTEWEKLWREQDPQKMQFMIENELAHVAINPHAPTGESFAFMTKDVPGREMHAIIHFAKEQVHTKQQVHTQEQQTQDQVHTQSLVHTHIRPHDERDPVEPCLPKAVNPEQARHQWAFSKKAGRPHPKDGRELELHKGEKIRILERMGRDWFTAKNQKNITGLVHGSWLNFGDTKPSPKLPGDDMKDVYIQFQKELGKMLEIRGLRSFPVMRDYVNVCTQEGCEHIKQGASSIGICSHDLERLLQGCDKYSGAWLKENRNFWHPDRFSRLCHPDYANELNHKAEQMFVLYGILMERELESA